MLKNKEATCNRGIVMRLKYFFTLAIASTIVLINELRIRPSWPTVDNLVSYIDHFIGSIIICGLIYLASREEKFTCLAYIMGCLSWELYQCINIGYFQIDKFIIETSSAFIFYYFIKKKHENIIT